MYIRPSLKHCAPLNLRKITYIAIISNKVYFKKKIPVCESPLVPTAPDKGEFTESIFTSFSLGMILMTSPVLVDTIMLDPTASNTSTLSVFRVSHGRAVNAYGFEVRAPTGHKSITFPDSSDRKNFSTYVPICGQTKDLVNTM